MEIDQMAHYEEDWLNSWTRKLNHEGRHARMFAWRIVHGQRWIMPGTGVGYGWSNRELKHVGSSVLYYLIF